MDFKAKAGGMTLDRQQTIGPIRLSPGISQAQVGIYLVTVVSTICVLTFIGLFLPFYLTEMMHVPKGEQGRLVSGLATAQQIAVLIFITIAGALADMLGRRRLYALAFGSATLLFLIYPFITAITALYIMHFMLGVVSCGNTGAGTAIMVDYPANESRGKFISMMLILQGLASLGIVGLIGGHIPGWLEKDGFSPDLAGRYSYWTVAAIAGTGFAAAAFFMRRDHRSAPNSLTGGSVIYDFFANLKKVIAHARANRKFAVALLMGFAARSDSMIMLAFLSLWITRAAGDRGVDTATAIKTAGYLLATFQATLVLTPLVFGFVADRLTRTTLLVMACGLAGCAFVSTALVTNVLSIWAYMSSSRSSGSRKRC